VTDRGDAGSATLGQIPLRQAAGEADLAKAFAKYLSFVAAIRSHSGQTAIDKAHQRAYLI
jgi:hypothetical protein